MAQREEHLSYGNGYACGDKEAEAMLIPDLPPNGIAGKKKEWQKRGPAG